MKKINTKAIVQGKNPDFERILKCSQFQQIMTRLTDTHDNRNCPHILQTNTINLYILLKNYFDNMIFPRNIQQFESLYHC